MTLTIYDVAAPPLVGAYGGESADPVLQTEHLWREEPPTEFGTNKWNVRYNAWFLFDLDPAIPSGDIITRCALRFTAQTADSSALEVDIGMLAVDGFHSEGSPASEHAWWQLDGADYRGGVHVDPDLTAASVYIRVLDTSSGDLVPESYAAVPDTALPIRRELAHLGVHTCGERVVVQNSGTLGFVDIYLLRSANNPGGNVWVYVHSGGDFLATSTASGCGGIATNITKYRFSFPSGQQVSLVPGSILDFCVEADYSPGGAAEFISVGFKNTEFPAPKGSSLTSGLVAAGVGGGICSPRYALAWSMPNQYEADGVTPHYPPFGSKVRATMPAFADVDGQYHVEGLEQLLQEWIQSPEYQLSGGTRIGFNLAIPDTVSTADRLRHSKNTRLVVEHRPAQSWGFAVGNRK